MLGFWVLTVFQRLLGGSSFKRPSTGRHLRVSRVWSLSGSWHPLPLFSPLLSFSLMVLFHNRILAFHVVHHSLKGNQATEHGLELPKLWAQTTFSFSLCLTFGLFLSVLLTSDQVLGFCVLGKYSTTELMSATPKLFSLYWLSQGSVIVTGGCAIQKAWPSNDTASWIFGMYVTIAHTCVVLPW